MVVAIKVQCKCYVEKHLRLKCEEMAVPLLLTILYLVLTTTCALVTKHPRNETLSILLLASTAASYNNSPSTLSKWVNDLVIKGANENWGYQLQLSLLDTEVHISCRAVTVSVVRKYSVFVYIEGAATFTYKLTPSL